LQFVDLFFKACDRVPVSILNGIGGGQDEDEEYGAKGRKEQRKN
jgi:hypothetical protein